MVKNWEDMSNKERAEQTIRDIKARQEKREQERLKGIEDADNYMYGSMYKNHRRKHLGQKK